MDYDVGIGSLDELITPIIMCDKGGLVIYKNEAAVKEIRLPRRNTHIQPHLFPGDPQKLDYISGSKKAAVINVCTGDRNAYAIVCSYKRPDGSEGTLWAFPAMIQTNAMTRYCCRAVNSFIGVADDYSRVIKAIDERSFLLDPKKKQRMDNRIKKYINNVIEMMFTDCDDTPYPVGQGIKLICDVMNRTLIRFGYDVQMEAGDCLEGDQKVYFDFRSFIIFMFHLVIFFSECGTERALKVRFDRDEEGLKIALTLSMPYPPFYTSGKSDIKKLMQLNPSGTLDVLIFDNFAKKHGYKFSYSINEDHTDNMLVCVTVPPFSRMSFTEYGLEEMKLTDESALCQDIVSLYTYLVKYRRRKN